MELLIPIFVCVVLPVSIVWITGRVKQNETNRKTEIMLKSIEAGATLDPEMFKDHSKRAKTIREELLEKLSGGCITGLMGVAFLALFFLQKYNPGLPIGFVNLLPVAGGVMMAVGIGLLVSYFAGKKLLAKDIEAEDKKNAE